MVKRAGPPRTRRGEPDKTNGVGFSNASRAYEGSSRPPQHLCERCGPRRAELLVIGEREGMAVYICRSCNEPRQFPMYLGGRALRLRGGLAALCHESEVGSACKPHEDRAAHDETCPTLRALPVGLCARCGATVRLAGEGQLLEETDGTGITKGAGRPAGTDAPRAEISAESRGAAYEKPRAGLRNPKRKGGADEAPPIEGGSADG